MTQAIVNCPDLQILEEAPLLIPSLPMARKTSQSGSSRASREQEPLLEPKPSVDLAASLEIYDTTLRDGAQTEDVSFSAEDKVLIAQKLDSLGVHFIEGGWRGANPKDIEFFRMIKTIPLRHAEVIAFGSTRKAGTAPARTPIFRPCSVLKLKTITLFGKMGPSM